MPSMRDLISGNIQQTALAVQTLAEKSSETKRSEEAEQFSRAAMDLSCAAQNLHEIYQNMELNKQ